MNSRETTTAYRMSQWAELIGERTEHGESIEEFCRRRGIKKHQYYYWISKLRKAAGKELAITNNPGTELADFAEVKLSSQLALPAAPETGIIRVEVSGIQITADSTYPTDKLAALLRELART